MVKFNVSILNRLKTLFFVNTNYIHKCNVSLNKTVTKLCTILTKCFFSTYLNPTSYLYTVLSQSFLISQKVFRENQVNLENTTNLNSSLFKGEILKFLMSGENLTWAALEFYDFIGGAL